MPPQDPPLPIHLFTDFGYQGPYVGQMIAAIAPINPAGAVISLMHDAPRMRPELAAYLLAAVVEPLPSPGIVVAVVDPGVGSSRRALVVETSRHRFVGPDNGLLSRLDGIRSVSRIDWCPPRMSRSFHGRDLFAPVAARLALGQAVESTPVDPQTVVGHDWAESAARVVYIDAYGNLLLGVRAKRLPKNRVLRVAGRTIPAAGTFSDVAPGEPFWYENSQGLVEIAANRASAATILSLALGDRILLD
jgi:S-adenosylmethionine hydrolase